MIGILDFIQKQLGKLADGASATGSALAKTSELLARFTTTVAGRIDAALSSLPSSGDYTAGRAARLDETGIKSSQHIDANAATATITSVAMTKTVLIWGGYSSGSDTGGRVHDPTIELANATTVNIDAGQGGTDVAFDVIEWN